MDRPPHPLAKAAGEFLAGPNDAARSKFLLELLRLREERGIGRAQSFYLVALSGLEDWEHGDLVWLLNDSAAFAMGLDFLPHLLLTQDADEYVATDGCGKIYTFLAGAPVLNDRAIDHVMGIVVRHPEDFPLTDPARVGAFLLAHHGARITGFYR